MNPAKGARTQKDGPEIAGDVGAPIPKRRTPA